MAMVRGLDAAELNCGMVLEVLESSDKKWISQIKTTSPENVNKGS